MHRAPGSAPQNCGLLRTAAVPPPLSTAGSTTRQHPVGLYLVHHCPTCGVKAADATRYRHPRLCGVMTACRVTPSASPTAMCAAAATALRGLQQQVTLLRADKLLLNTQVSVPISSKPSQASLLALANRESREVNVVPMIGWRPSSQGTTATRLYSQLYTTPGPNCGAYTARTACEAVPLAGCAALVTLRRRGVPEPVRPFHLAAGHLRWLDDRGQHGRRAVMTTRSWPEVVTRLTFLLCGDLLHCAAYIMGHAATCVGRLLDADIESFLRLDCLLVVWQWRARCTCARKRTRRTGER